MLIQSHRIEVDRNILQRAKRWKITEIGHILHENSLKQNDGRLQRLVTSCMRTPLNKTMEDYRDQSHLA